MIKKDVDVAVIGGGPAGLAAAISAKENDANQVLILDRNSWLGGILPQCIHDGFGIEETGKSMTGPEYAEKYIDLAKEKNIKIMNETMVLQLDKNKEIIAVNKKGLYKIKANAIVLAMGCREKTRWSAMIPGDRPSGIFTAGVAQSFINLYNLMPGKNIVILGSGDVGLIMARRLKFEGANVLGVVEFLSYTSGRPRNVVQCLDDYDIPLFLNHTITSIIGRERIEQITIAQVDKNFNPIFNTQKKIKCDTLLLSLGLIPENELSKNVNIQIDELTGGSIVDQYLQTSNEGIFACGNCLQVYDTVDLLTKDAKRAGKYASKKNNSAKKHVNVIAGKGIRTVVPQRLGKPGIIHFTLRVKTPYESPTLRVKSGDKELLEKKLHRTNPANMVEFNINISDEVVKSNDSLEVLIDGK
jgi:NADPH-dependent 2,4-dienoyl-CoA reductase/sulfur reductase-like enzyme